MNPLLLIILVLTLGGCSDNIPATQYKTMSDCYWIVTGVTEDFRTSCSVEIIKDRVLMRCQDLTGKPKVGVTARARAECLMVSSDYTKEELKEIKAQKAENLKQSIANYKKELEELSKP